MTQLLDHAIARVRGLPAAVQDDLGAPLLRLAGDADGPALKLSAEDRAALETADAEIARGAFAADAETHDLWSKPIP